MMKTLKKISLIVLVIGYLVAGLNHFRDPSSYLKIIPPYFPLPGFINLASGFLEIAFALMLIFLKTRRFGAWGIILLLVAFVPVHTKMVTDAPFMLGHFESNTFCRLGSVGDTAAFTDIVGMVVY